jgi:glycosyltransferase involved in cell wall biosynthesis
MFLIPYPLQESPSQRFRFEQYFSILEENGFKFSVQSFLNSNNWQLFFKPGNWIGKTCALVAGYGKRIQALFRAPFVDFIFIHREVAPIGPPFFEWILAKVLQKKIIYDFDDAIWLTDRVQESLFRRALKSRGKVKFICKWSYKVSCGNEYLCSYARMYTKRVVYNPTTVDTEHRHNPAIYKTPFPDTKEIVIGWTGSHSTLKYLSGIERVLQKIETKFPSVKVLVIADQKPDLKLNSLRYLQWTEKTEIEDLLRITIGIMPLPDDEWSKGKCGFKAIQYMSLKIPSIASAVGVNSKIIDHGATGFLCITWEEWEDAITRLVQDPILGKQMGERGRKKIVDYYSVSSNSSNFLSLFE